MKENTLYKVKRNACNYVVLVVYQDMRRIKEMLLLLELLASMHFDKSAYCIDIK